MNDIEPPICCNCSHKKQGELSCAAYPAGIPKQIIYSVVDHRKPYKNDHGIQYDPISDDFVLPEELGKGEIDSTVIC
jgi:hypothetical protein